MAHTQDLTALALVLALAVISGLSMSRLRMPAAAGFILVGMVLGPTGFGLIATSDAIETLADLGVLMLLFIIGMELRLAAFRALLPLAVGIALIEVAAAVAFTLALSQLTSGETTSAVVIGFMLAVSSTALAIKMMEDADEKTTAAGRLTLAVLVAQDLAVVPMLVVISAMAPNAGANAVWIAGIKLAMAVGLLVAFIAGLSRIKSFRFPYSEFFLKDSDIGTLAVLGVCFAAATLSGLLGLSPALGAFVGGLAVGHSTLRRDAHRMVAPVQSILLFTFFLSVGLLFDLHYLLYHLWLIVIVFAVVAAGKTFVNLLILRLFGQKGDVAFQTALFLTPVGEFSFVLATAGVAAGALTPEGHKLAIAVIALSLLVSPLWFLGARRAHMLALRGITEADALFRASYRKELFFLRLLGKKAAVAGAQAATVAGSVGSQAATRAAELYRERQAKRAADIETHIEPHFPDDPPPTTSPAPGAFPRRPGPDG
jgi:CPA2 family monovalent cation:H+ antiporter-2